MYAGRDEWASYEYCVMAAKTLRTDTVALDLQSLLAQNGGNRAVNNGGSDIPGVGVCRHRYLRGAVIRSDASKVALPQ